MKLLDYENKITTGRDKLPRSSTLSISSYQEETKRLNLLFKSDLIKELQWNKYSIELQDQLYELSQENGLETTKRDIYRNASHLNSVINLVVKENK